MNEIDNNDEIEGKRATKAILSNDVSPFWPIAGIKTVNDTKASSSFKISSPPQYFGIKVILCQPMASIQ